jgi:hypothetical protein
MQRLLAGVVHVPGRSALDLGGGRGKMEGVDWFGFFDRIERISEFGGSEGSEIRRSQTAATEKKAPGW